MPMHKNRLENPNLQEMFYPKHLQNLFSIAVKDRALFVKDFDAETLRDLELDELVTIDPNTAHVQLSTRGMLHVKQLCAIAAPFKKEIWVGENDVLLLNDMYVR